MYVDDARFEKIERHSKAAFMFAGDGGRIQDWKDWIRSNPTDDSCMPECELMSVCIVDLSTKKVLFDERQIIINENGYFAGSGSMFAFQCWTVNRDAKQAVETAKQYDYATGGDVKFIDLVVNAHNLNFPLADVRINDVNRAIVERGMVMEIAVNDTKKTPFKLAAVAANDDELQGLREKIANGELSPSAPCQGMHNEWTIEQKAKLKSVLGQALGWK